MERRGGIVSVSAWRVDASWFDGLNGRCKVQVHCKRWIKSAMLSAAALSALPALLPAQVAPAAPTAVTETREDAASRDIADTAAILGDRSATAAKREEAARRLVSRSSPEADSVLLKAIEDFNNRDAQIAVARALASDPTPQQMFVEPLLKQLGSGVMLTEAVAQ